MVSFDHSLDTGLGCICDWEKKEILLEVTIIRDVYGKLSFLMENKEVVSSEDEQRLIDALTNDLGVYFSNKIYWKKYSKANKKKEARTKLVSGIVEEERYPWKDKEGISFYVSERPIAKKAWVNNHTLQNPVWSYEEAVGEGGVKVVTFYSFKGGMGRTTALAAVALNLIDQGKNVMMIDADIEAPGLATLFFDETVVNAGVLDYLLEQEVSAARDIQQYVLDVTDPALIKEENGNLYLMPAGRVDDYYLQKLARIDYQDNRENHLRNIMEQLLKEIREYYKDLDYILIDARAGFHDMGGIAVSQLPQGSVLFGNGSRQSWEGIKQVLRIIAQGHEEDFPVMLVDTMCEKVTSPNFSSMKEDFIKESYTICVDCFYDSDSAIPGIEAEGSTHFPEFVPVNDELRQGMELYSNGDPNRDVRVEAYRNLLTDECYKSITARMMEWFGEV